VNIVVMTSVLGDDRLFEVEMGEAEDPKAAPAGEAKTFRRYDQSQCFLLPPSLDDWLDEDDEARFVSEVVEELLDLSPIYASYESASGAPPYEPRMMLKLLLYGYATGVTSSREIERRCQSTWPSDGSRRTRRRTTARSQPLSPSSPRRPASRCSSRCSVFAPSRARAPRARRSRRDQALANASRATRR
jgi:hypothetical protein